MPTTAAEVHVAVGVVVFNGAVLVSRRSQKQHLGGFWEFPGGKVEQGESVVVALARELKEELDIAPLAQSKLMDVRHDYGDKSVWLDVWWVAEFEGAPKGLEGQQWCWQPARSLGDLAFPEANKAILRQVQNQLVDCG